MFLRFDGPSCDLQNAVCLKRPVHFKSASVVVYHGTSVAIVHGLLKKFWPMVIAVLRTEGSSIV